VAKAGQGAIVQRVTLFIASLAFQTPL